MKIAPSGENVDNGKFHFGNRLTDRLGCQITFKRLVDGDPVHIGVIHEPYTGTIKRGPQSIRAYIQMI